MPTAARQTTGHPIRPGSVPSVVIDGKLASMGGMDLPAWQEAGLGRPL